MQIRRVRQRVADAVAQHHIYTMYGRYSSVREALRQRGWEDKPPPLAGKLQQHQDNCGLRPSQPKEAKKAEGEADAYTVVPDLHSRFRRMGASARQGLVAALTHSSN